MGPKFKGIAKAKPVSPAAAKVQARLNEAVNKGCLTYLVQGCQ